MVSTPTYPERHRTHHGVPRLRRREGRDALDVHEGTIHALIGPNGAGKTTVFNLLTKFLKPTRGRDRLSAATTSRGLKPAEVARLGLVRSFQISAVFPHLTVLDNVRVALQRPSGLATQFWRSSQALSALDDRAHGADRCGQPVDLCAI